MNATMVWIALGLERPLPCKYLPDQPDGTRCVRR